MNEKIILLIAVGMVVMIGFVAHKTFNALASMVYNKKDDNDV